MKTFLLSILGSLLLWTNVSAQVQQPVSQVYLHNSDPKYPVDLAKAISIPDGQLAVLGNTVLSDTPGISLSMLDQSMQPIWTKVYKNTQARDTLFSPNGIYAIARDFYPSNLLRLADGGYLIYGRMEFTQTKISPVFETYPTEKDMFILRVTALGSIYWAKLYNNMGSSPVFAFQLNDGGFMLFATSDVNSGFESLIHVIRLQQDGTPLWGRKMTNIPFTELRDVARTPDGGYIACATTNGFIVHAIAVKFNASGEMEWVNDFLEGTFTAAGQIEPDGNGGYFMLCTGSDNLLTLLHLNPNGAVLWSKQLSNQVAGLNLELINDGNFGCTILNRWQNMEPVYIEENLGLIHVDGTGAIDWANRIGNDTFYMDPNGIASWLTEQVRSIELTPDGYLIASTVDSTSQSDPLAPVPSRRGYIVKTTHSGETSCLEHPIIVFSQPVTVIESLPLPTFEAASLFLSNLEAFVAVDTAFVSDVKCGEIVNEVPTVLNGSFRAFPNPASSELVLEGDEALGDAQYQLFNALGQALASGRLTGASTVVDVSHMPAGIYAVILYKNGLQSQRLVVIGR